MDSRTDRVPSQLCHRRQRPPTQEPTAANLLRRYGSVPLRRTLSQTAQQRCDPFRHTRNRRREYRVRYLGRVCGASSCGATGLWGGCYRVPSTSTSVALPSKQLSRCRESVAMLETPPTLPLSPGLLARPVPPVVRRESQSDALRSSLQGGRQAGRPTVR